MKIARIAIFSAALPGGAGIVTAALGHLAVSTPPEPRDGKLRVGGAPGLGVEPDLKVLGEPVAVYG